MESVYDKQAQLAQRQSQLELEWKNFESKSKLVPTETPPFVIVIILLSLALIAVIIVIIASARQTCKNGDVCYPGKTVASTAASTPGSKTNATIPHPTTVLGTPFDSSSTSTSASTSETTTLSTNAGSVLAQAIVAVRFSTEPLHMSIVGRGFTNKCRVWLEYFDPSCTHLQKPQRIPIDSVASSILISRDPATVTRCRGILQNQDKPNIGKWGLRIQDPSFAKDMIFIADNPTLQNRADVHLETLTILQCEPMHESLPEPKFDHVILPVQSRGRIADGLRFSIRYHDVSDEKAPQTLPMEQNMTTDTEMIFVGLRRPGWYYVRPAICSNICGVWILME